MFDINTEDSDLDAAITAAFAHLTNLKPEEEGYQTTVDQLSALYKLKHDSQKLVLESQQSYATHQLAQDESRYQEEQNERPFYERVDPNTVLTVAGNIFIGLVVVKYEQTGVIRTAVTSFMKKI